MKASVLRVMESSLSTFSITSREISGLFSETPCHFQFATFQVSGDLEFFTQATRINLFYQCSDADTLPYRQQKLHQVSEFSATEHCSKNIYTVKIDIYKHKHI